MSRNLYTIAVVRPELADELRSIVTLRREDWYDGAGERLLAEAVAAHKPLVAFYRVVLDGWSHGLEELTEKLHDAPEWLASLAAAVRDVGFGIVEGGERSQPVVSPSSCRTLNAYAVKAVASALNDALVFAESTQCPMVVLQRTLYLSFDDSDFRKPRDGHD